MCRPVKDELHNHVLYIKAAFGGIQSAPLSVAARICRRVRVADKVARENGGCLRSGLVLSVSIKSVNIFSTGSSAPNAVIYMKYPPAAGRRTA